MHVDTLPHSITHTGARYTVPPIGRVYSIILHTWEINVDVFQLKS